MRNRTIHTYDAVDLDIVWTTAHERVQKVISVGILSKGWDAKTVTHIMGPRAFTSQLLCE